MRRATMLFTALLTGTVLAVCGPAAAPAFAAGNPVVSDCYSHGKLTRTYTKAELRHALAVMSSYIKQYSNCQSVVENALAAGAVAANGTGKSGGSSTSTPVIIVIVVVVLAIAAFAAMLIGRRRRLGAAGPAASAPTRVIEPDRPSADRGGDGGPAP